jgi:phage-related protein
MLALLLWTGPQARGQNMPSQDNDTRGWQIANMDKFLDGHPEIEEQLRKDPSLIRNDEFVEKHPALQQYLQQHPGIREEFTENPNAFMRQEQRYERREDSDHRNGDRDITRGQLSTMDRFMDSHPEIAEQLQKDPSLIKNREFVEKHPALEEFLKTHPGVREEFTENPNAFMRREQRFDRREDERDRRIGDRDRDRDDRNMGRDRDLTRGQLANMDGFLDSHPEIAEQLQKDPSLIKNKEFVEKHPALHEFLQTHPEVREEFRENPNAFMRQERRFDQREDSHNREMSLHDRDRDRGDMTSFGQFLGGHTAVAQQLSKDPSLANNKEFLASHPELQDYLKSHPAVKSELAKNPQAAITSATPATNATPATPQPERKHKQ